MFACFALAKGSVASSLAPSPVSFKRNLLPTCSSDAAARLTHSGSEDGLKGSFIQAYLGGGASRSRSGSSVRQFTFLRSFTRSEQSFASGSREGSRVQG